MIEFCMRGDTNPEPVWIEELVSLGKVRPFLSRLEQLNEAEQEQLVQAKEEWRDKYVQNWSEYLMENLPYKYPAILNGKELEFIYNKNEEYNTKKCYVGVFFMKPGRHHYVIRDGD